MGDWLDVISDNMAYFWVAVGGIIGRLIYHSGEVKMKRRKFFSRELVLEMPIALGMGFLAHAICHYFGITGDVETGVAILAGYLGPRSIDSIFDRFIENKLGKKEGEE